MAIITDKYLNLAVKTFDESDKYIDIEPVSDVVAQASATLKEIKNAVIDFAAENDADIRGMHEAMTSERGSRRNYSMQSITFAKDSFDDYVNKLMSIPAAAKNGTISEDLSLNAGFFERDKKFNIALFNTDENECVPIPAEDAFDELGHMTTLVKMTDEYMKQLHDKATLVPPKKDVMDGAYAKQYETSLMAIRLMATSMVRFCALLLRHIVNATEELYAHVTSDVPRWQQEEIPKISWKGDEGESPDTEYNRWAIFV